MKAYIAGPISGMPGVPTEVKLRRFSEAAEILMANGYETVNPIEVPVECELDPEACAIVSKHIGQPSQGQDGDLSHAWECYLKADIRAMLLCTHIALLPGWRESSGAALELQIAESVGMPVLSLIFKNGELQLHSKVF